MLSAWTGQRAGSVQTTSEHRAKQDRLLGASTLVQEIVSGQYQPDGVIGSTIQPGVIQSMIEHKASGRPLNFGLSATFLKAVTDAQVTQPDLFPGAFQFRHADLLRIAGATGGARLKLRQDLFQGITAQLASVGTLRDWP